MIKNIVFDMGGVLVGLDGERCIRAFREIGAEAIVRYVEGHLTEDLFYDIEIGGINTAEFCNEVRRLAGIEVEDDRIVWAWNELLADGIAEEKKQRLLRLREKGYRLLLLSNTNDMHWKVCRDKHFRLGEKGVDDYFERVFLSYKMRLAKPGQEIYRTMLREAGIEAGETIFIDDSAANLAGAAAVGINTFHEREGHRWLDCLEREIETMEGD